MRVTIKNFVAAAELVKHDQAECFDDFGRPALHPRAAVVFSSARSARRSRFLPTGKNLPFLKSLSVHGTSRERNCPFGFFVLSANLSKGGVFSMPGVQQSAGLLPHTEPQSPLLHHFPHRLERGLLGFKPTLTKFVLAVIAAGSAGPEEERPQRTGSLEPFAGECRVPTRKTARHHLRTLSNCRSPRQYLIGW